MAVTPDGNIKFQHRSFCSAVGVPLCTTFVGASANRLGPHNSPSQKLFDRFNAPSVTRLG
jgi:hypothetical protein